MTLPITWDLWHEKASRHFSDIVRPEGPFRLKVMMEATCRSCGSRCVIDSNLVWVDKKRSCGCVRKATTAALNKSKRTYGWVREQIAPIRLGDRHKNEDIVKYAGRKGAHDLTCFCNQNFGNRTSLKSVLQKNARSCGCLHIEHARNIGHSHKGKPVDEKRRKRFDSLASITAQQITDRVTALGLRLDGPLRKLVYFTRDIIKLICRCGTPFEVGALTFLRGLKKSCGCLLSWGEIEVLAFVKTLAPDAIKTRKIIPPWEVDVWVPEKRLAIEYNGLYWHGEERLGAKAVQDIRKKLLALEAVGARGLFFFEDEWLTRRNAVEGYIRAVLGKKMTVGARSCEVAEGGFEFVEAHHIQGGRSCQPHLSLIHKGVIVAAASFSIASSSRKGPGNSYELTRYCVGPEVSVAGGLSKLLAAWQRRTGCDSIVTYSDLRYSNGGIYKAAGFTSDRVTPPRYHYFKSGKQVRLHRFAYRKSELERKGWLEPGETEAACMKRHGYDRIWDAGRVRWVRVYGQSKESQSDAVA